MSASSDFEKRSLYHGWIPQTPVIHRQFLEDHFRNLPDNGGEHSGPVKAFLQVLADENITDEITRLFDGAVAQSKQYDKWADPDYSVTSFDDFLNKVDVLVGGPPKFYKAVADKHITIGEPIGAPIYLIFDLISNTSAAYTLLNRDDFNKALKALLDAWGTYLSDNPDSNKTLNENGWFSDAGLASLEAGLGKLTFRQTYITDREEDPKIYYKTWDSFFVRQLKEGVRPIQAQPTGQGEPFYLYNPCEATVFRTAENVRIHDTFWLKSQKYSLYEMLGGHLHPELSSYAQQLEGGSVLQSYLSPQDFHRWQSPVKGEVLVSDVVKGTYFAVLPDDGAPESDPDLLPGDPHGAMLRSLPWLSVAATRAVFIIKPEDDSPIDLIAFIAIGMFEVSTCDITYSKGHVGVGDQLGMFHFGGSSNTMVVKPKSGKKVVFQDIFNTPVRPGQHRWIRSVVGQIWDQSLL